MLWLYEFYGGMNPAILTLLSSSFITPLAADNKIHTIHIKYVKIEIKVLQTIIPEELCVINNFLAKEMHIASGYVLY